MTLQPRRGQAAARRVRVASAPADPFLALRRTALLAAMLISGGLMLFPREPMLLAIILLCLVITRFRLPSRRSMAPLAALVVALLVLTLVRPGPVSLPSLVSRFTHYAAAALLLEVYLRSPAGSLARDLRALLAPMAVQALATVALAHSVGGLFVTLAIGDQQYQTLLGLFNYHVIVDDLTTIIRPDGFFFEPGVYQIYLNLYLYLVLFVFRRPWQVLLAVCAVVATQSTTGLAIMLVLLAGALAEHLSRGPWRQKLLALLCALVLAPPILAVGYDNLTDKLFGAAQGSTWARQYDLFTGLNIIDENPWLGIGFEVERYLEASGRLGFDETLLTETQLQERPSSNGLVQLFYVLGVPMGLVFVWGMLRQRFFRHRLLIATWLLLSMFGEALLFTPFFLLVIFSGFVTGQAAQRRMRRRRAARTTAPQTVAAAGSVPPGAAAPVVPAP